MVFQYHKLLDAKCIRIQFGATLLHVTDTYQPNFFRWIVEGYTDVDPFSCVCYIHFEERTLRFFRFSAPFFQP